MTLRARDAVGVAPAALAIGAGYANSATQLTAAVDVGFVDVTHTIATNLRCCVSTAQRRHRIAAPRAAVCVTTARPSDTASCFAGGTAAIDTRLIPVRMTVGARDAKPADGQTILCENAVGSQRQDSRSAKQGAHAHGCHFCRATQINVVKALCARDDWQRSWSRHDHVRAAIVRGNLERGAVLDRVQVDGEG